MSGEDDDKLVGSNGRISVQLNTVITTVVGILDALGLRFARNYLISADLVGDDELVLAVWNVLVAGLRASLLVLLITAGLLLVGAWLSQRVSSRSSRAE